jgi:hypothetical protein
MLVAGGAAFASLEPDRSTADDKFWGLTTLTIVGCGDLARNDGAALS